MKNHLSGGRLYGRVKLKNINKDFIAATCCKMEFLSTCVSFMTNKGDQENNIYEKKSRTV